MIGEYRASYLELYRRRIMRNLLKLALFITLLASWSNLYASNTWDQWKDLAQLQPDAKQLQASRTARGHDDAYVYSVQKISGGAGKAINIDEYAIQIDSLPRGMSKNKFYWHVREHLNSFLDQSIAEFGPVSDDDEADWKSQMNALVGTLMKFEIKVALGGIAHDTGAVVVSKSDKYSWIFSPIEASFLGSIGTHPVAGNRQFGLRTNNGKLEFFTRAFDRVYPAHVSLKEKDAFEGADKLWRSLQKNLVNYINSNGGSAKALPPVVPGDNNPDNKPQYKDVCKDRSLGLEC